MLRTGLNPLRMHKARKLLEKTISREIFAHPMTHRDMELAANILACYYRILSMKTDVNVSKTLLALHYLACDDLEKQYIAVEKLERTLKIAALQR